MISQFLLISSLFLLLEVLVQVIASICHSTMTVTSEHFLLASGCLCLSVHNVWSCQTDLPKSQLGSYKCLAKKSYDCPCSTKKHLGSLGDFGGLFAGCSLPGMGRQEQNDPEGEKFQAYQLTSSNQLTFLG